MPDEGQPGAGVESEVYGTDLDDWNEELPKRARSKRSKRPGLLKKALLFLIGTVVLIIVLVIIFFMFIFILAFCLIVVPIMLLVLYLKARRSGDGSAEYKFSVGSGKGGS